MFRYSSDRNSSQSAVRANRSAPTHSMNKGDLVQAVFKSLGNGTTRAHAERCVDAVIEAIRTGLKRDKAVQLVGFGTFRVADRKARVGVNPKTGEKIKIKASKSVKFAAGKDLKSKVAGR